MDRPEPPDLPHSGDETIQLKAFLDVFRYEFLDRAWGLDDDQLQIALGPSTLTLSRLIAHMALVERSWFQHRFDGEDMPEPYASFDFENDDDAEMTYGQTLTGDELRALFNDSVADSRARVEAADSFDQLSARPHPGRGHHWDLRWIMIHMIEEYARHCGHADLIRESIDGELAL